MCWIVCATVCNVLVDVSSVSARFSFRHCRVGLVRPTSPKTVGVAWIRTVSVSLSSQCFAVFLFIFRLVLCAFGVYAFNTLVSFNAIIGFVWPPWCDISFYLELQNKSHMTHVLCLYTYTRLSTDTFNNMCAQTMHFVGTWIMNMNMTVISTYMYNCMCRYISR